MGVGMAAADGLLHDRLGNLDWRSAGLFGPNPQATPLAHFAPLNDFLHVQIVPYASYAKHLFPLRCVLPDKSVVDSMAGMPESRSCSMAAAVVRPVCNTSVQNGLET